MDLVFTGVFAGLVLLLVGLVAGCDRLMARGQPGRPKPEPEPEQSEMKVGAI